MSKITKAAGAPEGEIKFSYALASFSVSDDTSYETDDFVVLAEAESEPWLEVEYSAVKVESPAAPEAASDQAVSPEGEPVIQTVTDPRQEAVQESTIDNAVVEPAQAQAVEPTADTPTWKRR